MSLEDHRESLRHLHKSDFSELTYLHSLHKPLDRVLSTVVIVTQQPKNSSSFQSLLSDPSLFDKILNLEPKNLTPTIISQLKPILEDPNLNEFTIKDLSEAAYRLLKWIRYLYTEAIKPQDPEIEIEKLSLIQNEEFEIPQSLDDLDKESRDQRAVEFKAEREFAQRLLDEVYSQCKLDFGFKDVKDPSDTVYKLVKAMLILLGEEPIWEKGRDVLSDCETFYAKTRALDIDNLPRQTVDAVRVLLQDPDLRLSNVEMEAPSLSKVLLWITSVVNYCLMTGYIETGEAALSETAEEDALKQESMIVMSYSKLLDEGEGRISAYDQDRLKKLDSNPSLGDL
jgi:hypothetical protein